MNTTSIDPTPLPSEAEPQKAAVSLLVSYVNDMIAVEKDLVNATKGQLADSRMLEMTNGRELVTQIHQSADSRLRSLQDLSDRLNGQFGAVVKETVAAAAGLLAGVYSKLRQHPVSKMLRDDHTALNLAATSYGMLYSSALALGHEDVATVALANLNEIPMQIASLTAVIPEAVVGELADQGLHVDISTVDLAIEAIELSWVNVEDDMTSVVDDDLPP